MSERVEDTLTKVLSWLVGAAVGGAIGYACVAHLALASNPYALAAIICVFSFAVGFVNGSEYKVGVCVCVCVCVLLIDLASVPLF